MRMLLLSLKKQLVCAAVLVGGLQGAAAFDSIPKELRTSASGVSNTLRATWDRTLTYEENAKAEVALQLFEQGSKSAEQVLANPSTLSNFDQSTWDANGRLGFEALRDKHRHALQILTTPGEGRSAFLDRAGIITLEVAPELPARRTTHEDTRDLNEVLTRWRSNRLDSFIMANFHNSTRMNAYGNREEVSSIERNIVIAAGPRSREDIKGQIREELLWLGTLDQSWDEVGMVRTKRARDKSLASVTVSQTSGEASIDWVFAFDETVGVPRMTSASLEVAGRTWEIWTLQDWSAFDGAGRACPGTVTRETFNRETGALESTETRTLISVEPLDPKTIWD